MPEATAKKRKSGSKKERQLKVTLVRSRYGRLKSHMDCVRGLGLRKMHQSVTVVDTPETRGMINKIGYLLKVEEL